jgi:WD40 repeat protein
MGETGCLGRLFGKIELGVDDADARASLAAQRIAFARQDGLYLARGDGSGERKILDSEDLGGGAVFLPSVTADGKHVVFLSLLDLDVRDSTGRDLALNIVALEGTAVGGWRRVRLEKIAPPPAGGREEVFRAAALAWAPDGSLIAAALRGATSEGDDEVVLFGAGGDPMASYDLGKRRLTRVSSLSWSPDGASLILGLEGNGDAQEAGLVGRLDRSRAGRSGLAPALAILAPGQFPALSPDGGRIAVVEAGEGGSDLVVLSASGAEIDRYRRPAGRAPNRLFWSADGRYLYYYSLASTGPLGLLEITMLRCLDTRNRRVFDLVRLG